MEQDLRTDEALMLAYRDGEANAFEVLYARWRGPLYRYVLRQCGHAGQADELFQDVFMRVIGAAAGYEATAKFATWLFRIAHNRLVDHWRKTGREPVDALASAGDVEDCAFDPPGPEHATPERRAEQKELGAALMAALNELPEVQREAFLLAEEGGLTLEEIASIAGVGRETIKSRLRYATAKLRNKLESWR
ncbi:MAG: RNA polymerase sigma factor [Burkholderiales bacterium]|nr:RNA polymerase sigma factor [Burkholderiales bacterium]